MGISVDPLAPKSDVGREYALTNATEQGTLGLEYLQGRKWRRKRRRAAFGDCRRGPERARRLRPQRRQ